MRLIERCNRAWHNNYSGGWLTNFSNYENDKRCLHQKQTTAFSLICGGMLSVACFVSCNAENNKNDSPQTDLTADSTVVGKDTSPVDVRNDINHSDAEKLTLPGRDTTNSDVSGKKLKDAGQ